MYNDYFSLTERPFAITPDPRYLYMSRRHQEALAHLLYGLKEGGGFVQLTGEVGTGKTTLTRALLEQLPDDVDVALILNPKLTAAEFVASICDDLKVSYPADNESVKVLVDALNAYLLKAHSAGRRVVLIVDEAQNFQSDVLEQIRLLTNLETTKQKLLQIILVGQPELRELLARRDLRQLAQRITARYHLVPMSRAETKAYIDHRLKVAGANRSLFTDAAIKYVQRYSGGVPRLINIICDRALLGAYSADVSRVTPVIVKQAATELYGELEERTGSRFNWAWSTAVLACALVGVLIWKQQPAWLMQMTASETETVSTSVSPQTEALASGQSAAPVASPITPTAPATAPVATELTTLPVGSGAASLANAEPVQGLAPSVQERRHVITSPDRLRDLLGSNPASSDLEHAFSSLFAAWTLDYRDLSGVTGCERAVSARLHCHWSKDSWEYFVKLNRPGMIWLTVTEARDNRYLVLKGVDGEQVAFDVAGEKYLASIDVIKRVWSGRYLILWRPPGLGVSLIRPGDRGDLVLWLRRNLDRIQGEKAVLENAEVFDGELTERVKRFQRDRAIIADGLVGAKTLIHLNTASGDPSIPRLNNVETP